MGVAPLESLALVVVPALKVLQWLLVGGVSLGVPGAAL